MRHASIGIAAADRGNAFAKNRPSLKRTPPQRDRDMGVIGYLLDEPAAINPGDDRGSERKNAMVGRTQQWLAARSYRPET
jgi:hypothetical protein